MPLKSTKSKASQSSSHRPLPKMKPMVAVSHYLVVDATLPSHVFSDRSLFTTYVPSRKSHQTAFGSNIIIEGIGDVHVRVFVSGKSILFRFRDSWHVPSSRRHFLSCSTVILLGHQVMLAGRSPRMIYSHKRRLLVPELPKYIPFTRVDGLIVLPFDIPAPGSFSPEPPSTTTRSTAQTVLSLPASIYHPFAGLAFNRCLPTQTPQQPEFPLSSSFPSPDDLDAITAASGSVNGHAKAIMMSNTSASDGSHGGEDGLMGDDCHGIGLKDDANFRSVQSHGGTDSTEVLVDMDSEVCVALNNDAINVSSHGGADDLMLLPVDPSDPMVDGIVDDVKDQASMCVGLKDANFTSAMSHDGGADIRADQASSTYSSSFKLAILNSSIDSSDIASADAITLRAAPFTVCTHHYFPCTLPLISTLNTNVTCFPYSSLSFYDSSISSFTFFFNSNDKARLQVLHSSLPFSRNKFSPYSSSLFSTSVQLEQLLLIFSLRISFHSIPFLHFSTPSHLNLISSTRHVGLTVPALPSSAGLPIPTPHIYIVSRYSLCISISIRSLSLACLVCVPLSTGMHRILSSGKL